MVAGSNGVTLPEPNVLVRGKENYTMSEQINSMNIPAGAYVRPVQYASELLSRKEAAAYLGVAAETLAIWHCTGRYGLPIVKVGRLAKYRKQDLDAFITKRTVGNN